MKIISVTSKKLRHFQRPARTLIDWVSEIIFDGVKRQEVEAACILSTNTRQGSYV
jgi:hypothetical protein